MSTHEWAPVDSVEKEEGQEKHDTKVEFREMTDTKSLTDRINEKLLEMASQKKSSVSCGKKRSFEEISVSKSWTKSYDKDIPESVLEQCRDDICNICQVDMTSSVQRRQHYEGAKHEKKVRLMLAKLFTEADLPKKRKLEACVSGETAAETSLKKIESEVEREPGLMKLDRWQEEWLSVWDSPLPPLIISQCRLTKCDICHLTFTSATQARSHFDGKNHDKKLRAALDLYCGQLGLRVPRKHEDEPRSLRGSARSVTWSSPRRSWPRSTLPGGSMSTDS